MKYQRLLSVPLLGLLLGLVLPAVILLALLGAAPARAAEKTLPPGWLPVQRLDDTPAWADFRKVEDRVHLYLPRGVPVVRGVFVCYVFHSQDPRELARLWKFALVTVPWPFEYDLGHNDRRNGRYKLGHPVGDMSILLHYLEMAAKETNHPELAVAPIVGWLGQNGAPLCADLYKRAPDRVLAWADGWYNAWPQHSLLVSRVPVAAAWEFSNAKERQAERERRVDEVKGRPTPPPDLRCYATSYSFPHGIYSRFNFFAAFLDRCIALRLPDEAPKPGTPVKLRPVEREKGWAGDFNEISAWAAIAPVSEARGMVTPTWMPDAYMAWVWRSYHSVKPDLKLTAPVLEYGKRGGKWGGKECGFGYGVPVAAGTAVRFAAQASDSYEKVEFHDGDRILGEAIAPPWQVEGVRLPRGLRMLFAVGVKTDGTRSISRPSFLTVE